MKINHKRSVLIKKYIENQNSSFDSFGRNGRRINKEEANDEEV